MNYSPELERENRLDEVLAAYLSGVRNGSGPERQQLLQEHPDLAEELTSFFADQDRFERLAEPLRQVVPPAGRLGGLRDFGDYEALEEIARGGMGVVFRAWQKSLGRPVALKMLLAGSLASTDDLRRFRIEAEAAASLDHPHIVPIYEVGAHDSHPYISMRLIEGGSLAHVVRREGWAVTDREGACRVAGLVATVADAVHHAHQRGILHRDLKPANILLDARGQPHVTDFGLARRALATTRVEGQPAALTALTHTGAIVGTPAYMAPEQAGGRGSTIAADVYGLGAILYELLTGRAPFTGDLPLDVLRRVLDEEPVPPRSLNPQVPRDLEIICLKCLHKEPERRYASAGDLAEELTRFCKGEPILARPMGMLERGWRWARRKPTIALLAVALAVALVGGLGLTTWQWRRAEHHAREAEQRRLEADEQRDAARKAEALAEQRHQQAERHARVANKTLEAIFHLSESLVGQPGLKRFQKALVDVTLSYARELLQQRGNEFNVRVNAAKALYNAALITESIGTRAEAASTYRKALAIIRPTQREMPNSTDLQCSLIFTITNLAAQEDETDLALDLLNEARGLALPFVRAHPQDRELRSGLANIYNNLGARHITAGHLQEGGVWLRKAQEVEEGLVRDFPKETYHEGQLARTLKNLGNLYFRLGDAAQRMRYHRQAHGHFVTVVGKVPHDPRRLDDLARMSLTLAEALRDVGQMDEAWTFLKEVQSLRTRLVKENPNVLSYQRDLASTDLFAGNFFMRKKRSDEALRCFERARDQYADLVRRDASAAAYRKDLALSYYNLAIVYGNRKRRPEQLEALGKARVLQETLLKVESHNDEYRISLGKTLNNLGFTLGKTGRLDEARSVLHQAIETARPALVQSPKPADFRSLLVRLHGNLAQIEREAGRRDVAAAALLECRRLLLLGNNKGTALYDVARYLAQLAADVDKGKKTLSREEQTERDRHAGLALETLRQALARGFRDGDRLEKEADFAPLRQREEFRELVRKVRSKP